MKDQPLNAEVFALVLVRLAARPAVALSEVLVEVGVERASFDAQAPRLIRELGEAWEKRRGQTAMKFAEAVGRELDRIGGIADLLARQEEPRRVLASFQQVAPAPFNPDETLPLVAPGSAELPFAPPDVLRVPEPLPLASPSGETMQGTDDTVVNLDIYAELVAELRLDPLRAEETSRTFGLATIEAQHRVHNLWQLRFQSNTGLKARFEQAVEQKLLAKRGPRGRD